MFLLNGSLRRGKVGEQGSIGVPTHVDALHVEAVVGADVVNHASDEGDVIVARRPVAGELGVTLPARVVAMDFVTCSEREE